MEHHWKQTSLYLNGKWLLKVGLSICRLMGSAKAITRLAIHLLQKRFGKETMEEFRDEFPSPFFLEEMGSFPDDHLFQTIVESHDWHVFMLLFFGFTQKIYWGWANLQTKGFIFPLVVNIIVSINFNGSFRAGLRENGWLIVQCWFWPWNPGAGNAAHVQLRYHEENRSHLEAFTFFSIKALKRKKMKARVYTRTILCGHWKD